MEEDMLSMISDGGENSSGEGLDSSSAIHLIPPSNRVRLTRIESSRKFKSVVPKQNGNWGAQIYANHQRIWLGTSNSEKEATMAYDSTAIQFLSGDSDRNFPWTSITLEEPNFQSQYSTGALNMIKDGSYQLKFQEFMKTRISNGIHLFPEKGGLSCNLLFQKELTRSDVGKLNRLVVPKKNALKFFPLISESVKRDAQTGVADETQLIFFDRMMRSWKFRYCYWKRSQSFVFTRGWIRFVKEKQLKANDVIAFYSCESRERGKLVETFYLIDPIKDVDSSSSTDYANPHVGLQLELKSESSHTIGDTKFEEELTEILPASNLEKEGFKLFGVDII